MNTTALQLDASQAAVVVILLCWRTASCGVSLVTSTVLGTHSTKSAQSVVVHLHVLIVKSAKHASDASSVDALSLI